jgi:hypothetical protein
MTPRTVTYRLEVSEINSTREFLFNVESKTPLGSFTEGDLFKMENVAGFADTGVAGRIGKVMHLVYSVNEQTFVHQTTLFLASDNWWDEGRI